VSNLSRVLVPLLLIGLLAGGYWWYSNSNDDVSLEPSRSIPTQPEETTQPKSSQADPARATTREQPAANNSTRVEAVSDNTNSDAAQGVKGRILLPNGQPAAEVPLFLMESMKNDPIKVFLMTKSGQTLAPVSWGATAADGTFALGVRNSGKTYDLRITSASHPEINHQSLKVREEDWYDTGDLTLENGIIVSGRVIDEYSKAGIPDATVYLENSNQAHTALPTPGRERGIATATESNGSFVINNAPANVTLNLTAEAPGYAAVTLRNQQASDIAGGVTLEIARGQAIAGVVVDGTGERLANVKVVAQGMSQKTPQSETTTTGSDGLFHFPSLREGPYQLVTSSTTHGEVKTPPVMTGKTDIKLVLAQRPWVKLKVLGSNGRAVKAYRLSLKRHFPNNQLGIGNVPEFRDRRITPANYPSNLGGDWAAIPGLPPGEYRFQIEERRHAKSLSEPFTVRDGGEPVEVTARLTMGATITGTVVDDRGQPVRGALVNTDMNNAFSGDGGIFDLFRSMIPEKHSKAQTKTDGKGNFRLARLAFAEYMVRVGHPDFCEGTSLDIRLEEENQVTNIGTIQLNRGTIIEGFTTITGQAAGQIKVSLSIPPDENAPAIPEGQPQGPQKMPFAASTVSDNDGRYRLLKRVPPGRYKVVASRQSGDNNPFMVLLDMRETERFITLTAGQDRLKLDFDLPAR